MCLEIQNLTKIYQGKVKALDHVSFLSETRDSWNPGGKRRREKYPDADHYL